MNSWAFEKRLKKLKKDFQKNVQPCLRRHRFALSKSERSRLKHRKAISRMRRKIKRMSAGSGNLG
jgi:hypothetical protein